jgi:hypothetical protein
MSETPLINDPALTNHNARIGSEGVALPPAVGGLALMAEINATHTIKVGEMELSTNLPEGLNVFVATGNGTRLNAFTLDPTKLDEIPVGDFEVTGTEEWVDVMNGSEKNTTPVSRPIGAVETEFGKAIKTESFGESIYDWKSLNDTAGLMTALGYVVEKSDGSRGDFDINADVVAIPTPESVKKAASKLGVDIELFPDHAYIPGRQYLSTFSAGKYPVATGEEALYRHDIEDDHLTAVVLGGAPLKAGLKAAAEAALATNNDDNIDTVSQSVDTFTATLRGVVASSSFQGSGYGKEEGRATLLQAGERCGMKPDLVENILKTAQTNAAQFGMSVQQLD